MKPMFLARKSDNSSSLSSPTLVSATMISPLSGLSMQPIMFSKVVLPLPEGPSSTVKQAWRTRILTPLITGTLTESSW